MLERLGYLVMLTVVFAQSCARAHTRTHTHTICCILVIALMIMLRVAAHRLRNFLLMVAMHDYYYCILTGASPLQHKDKVPAEGAAPLTNFRVNLEKILGPGYKTL